MITNAPPKHPDSSKWYWLEWSSEELQGASITSSDWTVTSGSVSVSNTSLQGYVVGVLLSGGTAGDTCRIENRIITSASEDIRTSLRITVSQDGH